MTSILRQPPCENHSTDVLPHHPAGDRNVARTVSRSPVFVVTGKERTLFQRISSPAGIRSTTKTTLPVSPQFEDSF